MKITSIPVESLNRVNGGYGVLNSLRQCVDDVKTQGPKAILNSPSCGDGAVGLGREVRDLGKVLTGTYPNPEPTSAGLGG